LTALRYQGINQRNTASSFARISSGLRINKAADDAAGLAVAENLDATERSARQARRNINDGISVIQTAEGTTKEVMSMFKRMRELGVQAASETLNSDERAYANTELSALLDEAARITRSSEFNGMKLMRFGSKNVQVGVHNTANDRIAISLSDPTMAAGMSPSSISGPGLTGGFNLAAAGAPTAFSNQIAFETRGETFDLFSVAQQIENNGGTGAFIGVGGPQFGGSEVIMNGDFLAALIQDVANLNGDYGTGVDLTALAAMNDGGKPVINNIIGTEFKINVTMTGIINKTGFADGSTTSSGGDGIDPAQTWDISSVANANVLLGEVDFVIDSINGLMTGYGAAQNRLTSALNNIEVYTENVASAQSQIRDADFAHETAELAKNQIMNQASTSVLAQANQVNQGALRLLG